MQESFATSSSNKSMAIYPVLLQTMTKRNQNKDCAQIPAYLFVHQDTQGAVYFHATFIYVSAVPRASVDGPVRISMSFLSLFFLHTQKARSTTRAPEVNSQFKNAL